MATYNGERFIKQQVFSILDQLEDFDELIISDDGSSDNTVKIVSEIQDNRISLVKNVGAKGYTSNFENALLQARNNIIFLSDQDDIWEPNKVEVCVKQLNQFALVVHDARIVDANLNLISISYFDERGVYRSSLGNIIKFGYLGCCMAFKKEVLIKALPFPCNRSLCTHDNWLYLVGSVFFRIGIISEALIRYRRHGNNTSSGGNKKQLKLWFMVKYRVYLLWHLLRRSLR